MSKQLSDIPYSVLDLATVVEGQTPKDTFPNSLQLAQQAEQLGYTRYWFAEHHNMMNVASSATSILIGYVAGGTKTIRVGSGGIMLPNHSPLVVAEQFGTLESLYPGRIDLGLGRAPGSDQLTAMAIRGQNINAAFHFPKDLEQLQTYLSADNFDAKVRANPGEGLDIPIWILGSSTDSAHLAAAKGLPYAFASHFAPAHFVEAIDIYREEFRPSEHLEKPYMMACINVVAADTDKEATRLATSVQQFIKGVVTGKRGLLPPPIDSMDGAWNIFEQEAVEQMLTYAIFGGPETVKDKMNAFMAHSGVDEVMVTTHVFDHQAKLRSYEIFAEVMKGRV